VVSPSLSPQQTLENLFGVCRFSATKSSASEIPAASATGWERSRTSACAPPGIRTPDRPSFHSNGSLATMNVENLSRRDKILFNTKAGPALRDFAGPDALRAGAGRRLLYEHPKVETEGARSRFVSFDLNALTMENILLHSYSRRQGVPGDREDILLRIMDIVTQPAPVLPYRRKPSTWAAIPEWTNKRRRKAVQEVQTWREEGRLPSPTSHRPTFSEISNSLPYPQPGSAVIRKQDTP